jgi:hypothetical protein
MVPGTIIPDFLPLFLSKHYSLTDPRESPNIFAYGLELAGIEMISKSLICFFQLRPHEQLELEYIQKLTQRLFSLIFFKFGKLESLKVDFVVC